MIYRATEGPEGYLGRAALVAKHAKEIAGGELSPAAKRQATKLTGAVQAVLPRLADANDRAGLSRVLAGVVANADNSLVSALRAGVAATCKYSNTHELDYAIEERTFAVASRKLAASWPVDATEWQAGAKKGELPCTATWNAVVQYGVEQALAWYDPKNPLNGPWRPLAEFHNSLPEGDARKLAQTIAEAARQG